MENPKMFKESDRIATFKNWPYDFHDPKNLAKNGFYFIEEKEKIKCAFCGVIISKLDVNDDPVMKHKTLLNRFKDFLECNSSKNIPIGYNVMECQLIETDIFGGLPPSEYCHLSRSSARCRNVSSDFKLYFKEPPLTPDFNALESRIESFKSWPKPEIQDPVKLAEAGFYYTQKGDETCCFHCGGGLENWLPTQDPWIDHAFFFGGCGFLHIEKGRKFIEDACYMKFRSIKI